MNYYIYFKLIFLYIACLCKIKRVLVNCPFHLKKTLARISFQYFFKEKRERK
jgi:hypothetical protein